MTAYRNRVRGDEFEGILQKMAQLSGLLPEKNNLTAFYTPKGLQLVKSELDFKIITQEGRIAYVDAKSFIGDFFTFSDLNPKQVKRACTYNRWSVPSGFVIWLRGTGGVYYYNGLLIEGKGSGSRFTKDDGLYLGPMIRFDLKRIFE